MAQQFKTIQIVPNSKEFADFILSKTQRKTPTVIHRHFAIGRIRDFYMRKVKTTQQNFHERLTIIVEDFPKIDDLHPFYSDLLNILYDKDHYKIALSQVNLVRNIIDNISREYVKLLKFGDSLYRCKCLKRIALGRMVKAVKKIDKSLVYLEQVRQHISRLPNIDPTMRTLVLCGYPNVGKSSFINKVSRADVDVQPYAFTTKSIYVGHTDYNYLRWQVIDTPGILDHPLEEMNTIEMQSITALAHLTSCIIFMMDISEQCGYSIEEQISLFRNIKPIFSNKPLVIGLNKIDVVSPENIPTHKAALLEELRLEGIFTVYLSTLTDDGVMLLRKEACDRLLDVRVQTKMTSKKFDGVLNRLHIAKPNDSNYLRNRPPCLKPERVMLANIEEPLPNEILDQYVIEPRRDPIPEIIDGKNIMDYVNPNIIHKMKELLLEEKLRQDAGFYNIEKYTPEQVNEYIKNKEIEEQTKLLMMSHSNSKTKGSATLPKSKLLRSLIKQSRSGSIKPDDISSLPSLLDRSQGNLASEMKLVKSGLIGNKLKQLTKIQMAHINKTNRLSRKGEGDHHIPDLKPKHLFSGKRKAGKTSRR